LHRRSRRADGSEVFTSAAVSHNLKPVAGRDDDGFVGRVDVRVKEIIVRWLQARS
jgi:hypothetical protein